MRGSSLFLCGKWGWFTGAWFADFALLRSWQIIGSVGHFLVNREVL